MKWIKTILLLQAVVIVLSLTGFAYLYNKIETERPSTSNAIPTPSREQVNAAVAKLIATAGMKPACITRDATPNPACASAPKGRVTT